MLGLRDKQRELSAVNRMAAALGGNPCEVGWMSCALISHHGLPAESSGRTRGTGVLRGMDIESGEVSHVHARFD